MNIREDVVVTKQQIMPFSELTLKFKILIKSHVVYHNKDKVSVKPDYDFVYIVHFCHDDIDYLLYHLIINQVPSGFVLCEDTIVFIENNNTLKEFGERSQLPDAIRRWYEMKIKNSDRLNKSSLFYFDT